MVSEPWENQLGSRIVLRLDAPAAGRSPVAYDPKSREFRFAGSIGGAEIAIPAPAARPEDLDAAADDIVKRYRARATAAKD